MININASDYCPYCSNPPTNYVFHSSSYCPNRMAKIEITCKSHAEHNRVFDLPIIINSNNKTTIVFKENEIMCKDCVMHIESKAFYATWHIQNE